ncbi:MAG: N-formylglutamate amidohydrolase [Burkholderiales bacterium]|nr:N-formylglutamate amidohydrolase [Burkholderiales bacterium]
MSGTPYTYHGPEGEALPLVFDSPHSGTEVPPYVCPAAPREALMTGSDLFVDRLYGAAPRHGCALIAAAFPRWMIDANRAPDDLDAELIDGAWPGSINPGRKTLQGMGVIRRYALPGVPVYGRRLAVAEIQRLFREHYEPYHEAVRRELDQCHARFGAVWHVDCHSMKSRGNAMNDDPGRERPDFVVGDLEGQSAEPAFVACAVDTLAGMGYRVNVNDPYKGAYLVRAYSNPGRRRHSIQIELNRALYMDESRFEPHQGFDALARNLEILIRALAGFVRARIGREKRGKP